MKLDNWLLFQTAQPMIEYLSNFTDDCYIYAQYIFLIELLDEM